jgi:hypothetical protein
VTSVPLRRSSLALILTGAVGLVCFVLWRAPVISEEWEHYKCVKRHSADSELHKSAWAALGDGSIPKSRVRAYLKENHPELQVHDDEAGIRAGTLVFSSDVEVDRVRYVPQPMPCPVA